MDSQYPSNLWHNKSNNTEKEYLLSLVLKNEKKIHSRLGVLGYAKSYYLIVPLTYRLVMILVADDLGSDDT
jgi:hypothetical protein